MNKSKESVLASVKEGLSQLRYASGEMIAAYERLKDQIEFDLEILYQYNILRVQGLANELNHKVETLTSETTPVAKSSNPKKSPKKIQPSQLVEQKKLTRKKRISAEDRLRIIEEALRAHPGSSISKLQKITGISSWDSINATLADKRFKATLNADGYKFWYLKK